MKGDMVMKKKASRQVTLNVSGLGMGSIVIGGVDLSAYVSETILHAKVGELATVTLIMPGLHVTAECRDAIARAGVRSEPSQVSDVTT
jgi:hypothetical protein